MTLKMDDITILASVCIVCLVVITTRAADPIVTKVTRPDTAPTRIGDNSTTLTPSLFHTIRFKSGVCRHGKHDVMLYGKTAKDCINECRKRTMCTAVNMYLNVGECRFNFEDDLPEMDCPKFLYSAKESWTKKWMNGCELLNCAITETCMEINDSHVCVTTECANVRPLLNGQVLGNRVDVGVTKSFSCNHGYKITGSRSTTCLPDGSWDNGVPVCSALAVNCSIPRGVQNGTVSYHPQQTLPGNTADVTCDVGFNMSGNSVITCQSNGAWSEMPVCNLNSSSVNCFIPPDVHNGTIVYHSQPILLGDTANITCNVGFNMSGNSVITCKSNDTWSEMPVCNLNSSPVNCSIPPNIQNGTVNYHQYQTLLGDTANVTCNTGFNMSGNSVITCQSNGTWSEMPVCNLISSHVNCSIPPNIQNGTVNYNPHQTLLGDIANIACNVGFNMSGNSVITCQSNGTWSEMPVCNLINSPVNCPIPPDVQNGTVDYNLHQTLLENTARVTCNVGFNMSGNSLVTCQGNGTWSDIPVCTLYRGYGDACVDTCSEDVHECRKDVCSCVFGMYFDPNTKECVTFCESGFSTTSYQAHENTTLPSFYPVFGKSNVPDLEACFRYCLDKYTCTTFVLSRSPNQDVFKCELISAQLTFGPVKGRVSKEGSTLYFRDCAGYSPIVDGHQCNTDRVRLVALEKDIFTSPFYTTADWLH